MTGFFFCFFYSNMWCDMAPQYSAKHHSNMQCQCVPERRDWKTKTKNSVKASFTKMEKTGKCIVRHLKHLQILYTPKKKKKSLLQEHACDDEGEKKKKKGASRYFRRRWDVRVSGRVAHQAAGRLYTLSPSSKTPCPLSLAPREPCLFYPRLFGHMKLEKMMLIIWQTKRTLVDGSSWDPQGLFQKKITSVQDERDGSGQTCDRPRCT